MDPFGWDRATCSRIASAAQLAADVSRLLARLVLFEGGNDVFSVCFDPEVAPINRWAGAIHFFSVDPDALWQVLAQAPQTLKAPRITNDTFGR
ncbi:MAG TPA: hypothetical protein VG345_15010 [Bryobacteraceae bacterium]|jgi:hypothetical protein|nr:hypothetical protein [Bryobacteraceae bacterium]